MSKPIYTGDLRDALIDWNKIPDVAPGTVDGWMQIRISYYNDLLTSHGELLVACKRVEEAWAGNGDMSAAVDACLLAIAKVEGK